MGLELWFGIGATIKWKWRNFTVYKAVYKDVNFDKDLVFNLSGTSNRLFKSFKHHRLITVEEFKYFHFEFKKTYNYLEKMCLLPTMEMRKSRSYIKDSGDFINKSRKLVKIPDYVILILLM